MSFKIKKKVCPTSLSKLTDKISPVFDQYDLRPNWKKMFNAVIKASSRCQKKKDFKNNIVQNLNQFPAVRLTYELDS